MLKLCKQKGVLELMNTRYLMAASIILIFALISAIGFIHVFPGETAPAEPIDNGSDEDNSFEQTPLVADYILTGGKVIDGVSDEPYQADVAVKNGRIIFVGQAPSEIIGEEIDVSGLIVAPGFINSHSHTYEIIHEYRGAKAALRQGITTEVGGVDGRSPWPIDEHFKWIQKQGVGVNYALLAGQGTIRARVIGYHDRAAATPEIELMQEKVRQAMREGALGLSTGLEYVPGSYTPTAELISLSEAAAEYDGVYVTHMRSEGAEILQAIGESLIIGEKADISVGISHFKVVGQQNWHLYDEAMEMLNEGLASLQKDGNTLWYDVYPYLSPDYAADMSLAAVYQQYPAEFITPKIPQMQTGVDEKQSSEGRHPDPIAGEYTLAELAEQSGVTPGVKAQEILNEHPGARARVIMVSEEQLAETLTWPNAVIANDASARPPMDEELARRRHPRGWGTFPRILARYTGPDKLSLTEAVTMMTSKPAEYLQLPQRGTIKKGYWADITVFCPDTAADTASFTNPQSYPQGIEYVWVNGEMVLRSGEIVDGVLAGRVITGPGTTEDYQGSDRRFENR